MKIKGYPVTTAIIIAMALFCVAVCGWQTAHLLSFQNVFGSAHPDYVPHSWILLTELLAVELLACGQFVLCRKKARPVLCGSMSAVMTVLEVLALRAAADQHYHMGILISDYGIQLPFDGGWLLLVLVVALMITTITQLLIVLFSAILKRI